MTATRKAIVAAAAETKAILMMLPNAAAVVCFDLVARMMIHGWWLTVVFCPLLIRHHCHLFPVDAGNTQP